MKEEEISLKMIDQSQICCISFFSHTRVSHSGFQRRLPVRLPRHFGRPAAQVQYAHMLSCFGLPKFVYCLRTCDPALLNRVFTSFDEAQCRALGDIVGASIAIDNATCLLASLPVSLGGLATRSAIAHSAAAFIASCRPKQWLVVS
jgi:hypothetical protein